MPTRNTNLPCHTIYYMWSHDLVKFQVERLAIGNKYLYISGGMVIYSYSRVILEICRFSPFSGWE